MLSSVDGINSRIAARSGASFGCLAANLAKDSGAQSISVDIPADPGPPQRADLIDDFRRVRSAVSQIAAMNDAVRCNLPQISENCLKGAQVAVNIRNDRDSQFVSCRSCEYGLDLAR